MNDNKKVHSIRLKNMAASIAKNNGDQGAIIISFSKDELRFGVFGVSGEDIQDALCLAIYYNQVAMNETGEG